MKLRSSHTITLAFVALAIAVGIACIHASVSYADSGQAFSISPPLMELKGDPGQTTLANIKLTNISNSSLLIKTQYNDFGAKDETGVPNIIFDDTQNTPYSLRQWLAPVDPFILKSKETRTLSFPINIPKDAEPGGHYAVIRFSGTAPELQDTGVSLSASVGSLVLMTVSGNIQEKASLADFYTASPSFAKATFFENGPITFVERIQNEGNVHVLPTGTVTVTNGFGQKIETLRVNGDPSDLSNTPKNILPGSIRRFDQLLNLPWLLGPYKAQLNLKYGNGKIIVSTTTFWAVPYRIILVLLVILLVLFIALRWGIKRYNAYIIRKARRIR